MAKKMTAVDVEKNWEGEDYARTLSEAESIKKDPNKLKLAKAGAARLVERERERFNGLKRIANMKEKAIKNIRKK